ncbi:ABC transporter permease [Thermogemmatispora sp.]|uniref:ABC transporter permease n=1 Tax=Thermogemmatispora sp. TaxID=1968838 RepID=UPI001D637FD0|nr:ABC transporter permease [Thermogemmatispora sp.]MBX5450923.1 ABC transporter permease [Thermogemmatispora sp.]
MSTDAHQLSPTPSLVPSGAPEASRRDELLRRILEPPPAQPPLNRTWNAIVTIAAREIMRYLRDGAFLLFSVIMPILLILGLEGPLQSNFGAVAGYSLMAFAVTGMLAMTLYQYTLQGILSLLEDRENDFTQELLIAPVSRYALIFGKILGASVVALVQGLLILLLGIFFFHFPVSVWGLLLLLPVALLICFSGGALGVLLLSLFNSQRSANQAIPLLLFPQFFLAGIFIPMRDLPWYLDLLSKITPLRYAVDLLRNVVYSGQPEYGKVVLEGPVINLAVVCALTLLCLVVGTILFVRSKRER